MVSPVKEFTFFLVGLILVVFMATMARERKKALDQEKGVRTCQTLE